MFNFTIIPPTNRKPEVFCFLFTFFMLTPWNLTFYNFSRISPGKFASEILSVIKSVAMATMLSRPSTTDKSQTKFLRLLFLFLKSGVWFVVGTFFGYFFLFFINHQCYSNCFKRNQRMWISDKTANVTKYFFCSKFVLDWFIHVPGFITITYFILRK